MATTCEGAITAHEEVGLVEEIEPGCPIPEHDFPLRGGVPPNSAKEKIRYKQLCLAKKNQNLALFGPFFKEIFDSPP